MRIFVTGGTGFVGTPVVRELQKRGHKLLLLVRRTPKGLPAKNITPLRGDLSGVKQWESKVKHFKPDAVLHLGWEGIPDYGFETSLKNLLYGLDIIRLAKLAGAKKVFITGSCWEYGATRGSVKEDAGLHVKNAFSAAKTALHYFGAEFAKKNDIDFIWARFFYVYGPGQKSHSLIPHIIDRMHADLPPDLKTPGAMNDFIYVDDVARALRMLVEKHRPGQSDTYNIGSGRLTAVKDVVRAIYGRDIVKAKKTIGFYADIGRIGKEIGWKPKISVGLGIRKILKYHRGE